MPKHHPPLPRLWLMTDERMGDQLLHAIKGLPTGSGVIFRHYGLSAAARRAQFKKVQIITRRKGLLLLFGGSLKEARALKADGAHGRMQGALTAPVHNRREIVAAQKAGAALLFASPVFTTRSHPKGKALGRVRFGLMIRHARVPVIALGGMDEERARGLHAFGIYGWAGIDAFMSTT